MWKTLNRFTDKLADYDTIKRNLFMQAVCTEDNKEELKNIPHQKLEDMSIIYRVFVEENDSGIVTAIISNEFLDVVGISKYELFRDAQKSQQDKVVICRLSPEDPMYIATNIWGILGSGVIAQPDFFESAADIFESNYFIIPSSVHEILLLIDDGKVDYKDLMHLVRGVNDDLLRPEQRLTYNVYHYDIKDKIFETARKYTRRTGGWYVNKNM